jgi:ribosomal-protein-alanine N-acetyltransferase
MIHHQNRESKAGRSYSLGLWLSDGKEQRFIGQVTLGGIVMGAYRGGYIGYWIDQRYSGRGYMTRAVTALTDFGLHELQLHRIEICLRPENAASRKVAEKAGYFLEGSRPRFLHIDGDWRDHIVFVKENPAIQ